MDTYVEGLAGAPAHLNPLFAQYNAVDRDLCALIFEGLTAFDEKGKVVPLLAKGWDVSEDGLSYTFYLREGVFWHDGAPFTADDVLFTVRLMQDPEFLAMDPSGMYDLWSSVSVDKLDNYTVTFTLAEPFAPFLDYTTMKILPAHLLEKIPVASLADAQFNAKPVGTGPYAVDAVSAKQITLRASGIYYGDQPHLKTLTFRFYPDASDLLAAYERGEILGLGQVVPAMIPDVQEIPTLSLYSARLARQTLVLFNLADEALPFFQDVAVRQALLWGLDRQGLIDRVLDGQGLLADSPIFPGTWAYNPDIPRYSFDPTRAAELLAGAGWKDSDGDGILDKEGQPLSFSLMTSDDATLLRVAEEVARQWRELGVDCQVEETDFYTLVGNYLYPRRFQALLISLELAGDPDPYPLWHSTQHSEEGQNWSGFAHRRADEVMEEARMTTDEARRTELYHEFQEIFAEQVPAVLLYYPVYNFALDTSLKNVVIAPMMYPSDRFRGIAGWEREAPRRGAGADIFGRLVKR